MNNYQRQFDILDILNVFSFLIAIENLAENRDQSEHNDVQAANNEQADYLLGELNKKFDEQNEMLHRILDILESR